MSDQRERMEITGTGPRDIRLIVGGVDVATVTLAATLHLEVDEIPRITLTLEPISVLAALSGVRVHLEAFEAPVPRGAEGCGLAQPRGRPGNAPGRHRARGACRVSDRLASTRREALNRLAEKIDRGEIMKQPDVQLVRLAGIIRHEAQKYPEHDAPARRRRGTGPRRGERPRDDSVRRGHGRARIRGAPAAARAARGRPRSGLPPGALPARRGDRVTLNQARYLAARTRIGSWQRTAGGRKVDRTCKRCPTTITIDLPQRYWTGAIASTVLDEPMVRHLMNDCRPGGAG
jgi:hypothetical protein